MKENQIYLADAIKNLRKELMIAMKDGEGESLNFQLDEIEAEFKCGIINEDNGNIGIKFCVLDAGLADKFSNEKTQTIRLKMKPIKANGGFTVLSAVDNSK